MSAPTMKTGVVPRVGSRHWAKPITTGNASVTPATDSARNLWRSSTREGSSKHLVPSGTIQRSAAAWSIISLTMSSKLVNRPICTVTRTIENTIPVKVATKRSRSNSRFRQASLKINDIVNVTAGSPSPGRSSLGA